MAADPSARNLFPVGVLDFASGPNRGRIYYPADDDGAGAPFNARLAALGRVPRARGIAARLGLLSRVPLTPEGTPAAEAIAAIRTAAGQGERLLNLSFHSPSLVPGNTPLPWERAVNLVDMALYLAKAHGRNRAYGVRGFENFGQTSMEAIEQDLERAWRAGFVDLSVVLGGDPDTHPPAPNEHLNVVSIKQAGHKH